MDTPDKNSDGASLTVTELIRVLTQHQIELPTSRQRKQFYVDLYNEHIKENITEDNPVQTPRRENPFQSPRTRPKRESSKMTPAKQTPSKMTPALAPIHRETILNPGTPQPIIAQPVFQTPLKARDPTPVQSAKSSPVKSANASPFRSAYATPVAAVKSDVRSNPEKQTFKPRNYLLILIALVGLMVAVYLSPSGYERYCHDPKDKECLPCPEHAVCSERFVVKCVSSDYVLKKTVISQIVPLEWLPFPRGQPTCVFDNEKLLKKAKKQQQVDHLIEHLDIIVRKWMGNVECGQSIDNTLQWAYSKDRTLLGMPQSLAKQALREFVGNTWTQDKFDEYWDLVLYKVNQSLDQVPVFSVVDDHTHSRRLLKSERPVIHSTFCSIRRSVWSLVKSQSHYLLIISVLSVSTFFGYQFYVDGQKEKKIVMQLVEGVLDAVHTETEYHHLDSVKHPLPGHAVSQLRDHFLPLTLQQQPNTDPWQCQVDNQGRAVFPVTDGHWRDRIWKQVNNHVLKNSSIRETVLKVKGESTTVWMWIGSAALSPVKKRSFQVDQDTPVKQKIVL
ncbi:Man1-Src1p-C-terminal domain-containing protein [Gorgonomyces haynaldii]|nr:Man1-Src1p-C-terminal domain-containing protein [Gorgonomyces haynaldii]